MKINREIRRISRDMLKGSFTDNRLDQGKITSLVSSLAEKKPRHYIAILENYKRLVRLEVEARHVRVESAGELSPEVRSQITSSLERKYGSDLTTEFVVSPELLGGLRIRVGSDVWDGSIRSRLQRLEQNLTT